MSALRTATNDSEASLRSLDVQSQGSCDLADLEKKQEVRPHLHIAVPKPRHELLQGKARADKHVREAARIIKRICERQVIFVENTLEIEPASEKVLQNIGECLREYFELEFKVIGHVGTKEMGGRTEDDMRKLSIARAHEISNRIYAVAECAAVRIVPRGVTDGRDQGMVTFEALKTNVGGLQERLDLIVQRSGWHFVSGSGEMTEKGRSTASLIARLMREASQSRLVIMVPRNSSSLAQRRCLGIAEALRSTGMDVPVVLRNSSFPLDRARVFVEKFADREDPGDGFFTKDPADEILHILAESPDLFKPRSGQLASHAEPVMRRVAAVLRRPAVANKVCVVEAFTGKERSRDQEAKISEVMQQRAQNIVYALHGEGVEIPCRVEVFSGPYPETPDNERPVLVITLERTDESEYPVEHEYGGVQVCCGGRH